MSKQKNSGTSDAASGIKIAAPKGKLGIMTPGMGAVATTFVAGVEAVRRGFASPIGSLTQMATIRLGKRTEGRSPLIKDFIPLANLDDLVFTGWDIFEDNMYAAAKKAGVLENELLEKIKPFLQTVTPRKAVFDRNYVKLIVGREVYLTRSTLQQAEKALQSQSTLRISRSCIVNMNHVREVSRTPRGDFILVLAGGTTVTSSEGHRDVVRDYLARLKLGSG